jgi:hypothetical protein
MFESMAITIDPKIARKIDRVTDVGISVSGIDYQGPTVLVGAKCLYWNVPLFGLSTDFLSQDSVQGGLFHGWTPEVFTLFRLMASPPEMIVFGTGNSVTPLPRILSQALHELGIQIEVQKTVR